MPYFHWETEEKLLDMKTFMKKLQDKKEAHDNGLNTENSRLDKDRELIRAYWKEDHPLHIRRTLDQYYYYTLDDTTSRDKDQVASRYFERARANGKEVGSRGENDKKVVMMVDQLWLWILGGNRVSAHAR
jgi:hypothetical protein